jgi:hypothetical protein
MNSTTETNTCQLDNNTIEGLAERHLAELRASTITDDVIRTRGYKTITDKAELREYGFAKKQLRVPGLLLPGHPPSGLNGRYVYKPDYPRVIEGKKLPNGTRKQRVLKYEAQKDKHTFIDVPPLCKADIDDPSVPLWITEGQKKADALASHGFCAIALLGIWNWRGSNVKAGKVALPDWEQIALNGREVNIVFDSDIRTNPHIRQAALRLKHFVESKGAAKVFEVVLEEGEDGAKMGVDDWFAAGGTDRALYTLRRRDFLSVKPHYDDKSARFFAEDGCIYERTKKKQDGDFVEVNVVATNFDARITKQAVDVETHERFYSIAVMQAGRNHILDVPSTEFADPRKLRAAMEQACGAGLFVERGYANRLPDAISLLSGADVPTQRRFSRTGWYEDRFIIPGWEQDGEVIELQKKLAYRFEPDADLNQGLAALDMLLQAYPAERTAPILAFMLGAPMFGLLGHKHRYGLHIEGETGAHKSTVAQSMMALYGHGFTDDQNLIRFGYGATPNAMIRFGSYVRDLPMLLDNWKSNTGRGERDYIALIHALIEGTEKDRANRSGGLRQAREAHAWPFITGEDTPHGDAAAVARMLVVPFEWPVDGKDIDKGLSRDMQGMRYHLNAVGAEWIRWLQNEGKEKAVEQHRNIPAYQKTHAQLILESLSNAAVNVDRVAHNLAMNQVVWETMRQHPTIGMVAKYNEAYYRGIDTIRTRTTGQASVSREAAKLFAGLRAMSDSDRYRIVDARTRAPITDKNEKPFTLLGWKDEEKNILYLLPSAITEYKRYYGAHELGDVSNTKLYRQMAQMNLFVDKGGDKSTKQKRLYGQVRRVLVLRLDALGDMKAEEDAPSA